MQKDKDIKGVVKEKYAEIAVRSATDGCCETSCCGSSQAAHISVVGEDYEGVTGYVPEADLGLGCGLPTEFAGIKEGDTVVDLGSGAGNDVFIARSLVGEAGKVIGIDMTREMIDRAEGNNRKLGFSNVEFRLAEIEALPLDDDSVDVVVSNCVLNLVPDKKRAFSEIHRVLRTGAHFCVSDIVLQGELPEPLRKSAEMYAGCVAGALQRDDYLRTIDEAGFSNVEVKASREVQVPEDTLREYLSEEDTARFRAAGLGIFSITVVGYKAGRR
jgi:ubiquinone/menaquinone biosynthesis C-methylase UbiE